MPISLPANPQINDTYTFQGRSWRYDGAKWVSSQNVLVAGNGAVSIAVGSTAQRPVTPAQGDFRINSSTNYMEAYYNSAWRNTFFLGRISATGGDITVVGNYKLHTFRGAGTMSIIESPVDAVVEYLIVGGGGGGGETIGGGGGAGKVDTGTINVNVGDAITVVIGAGGLGGWDNAGLHPAGTNGTASTFSIGASTVTAAGGGAGGGYNVAASGVGGGAGGGQGAGGGAGLAAGSGQFSGGTSGTNGNSGAGGGGAGAVGSNSVNGVPGAGGIGIVNPISGSRIGELQGADVYYIAGGGGGGNRNGTVGVIAGVGGLGGGGDGIYGGRFPAFEYMNGQANTGGGGGGGGYTDSGTVNGQGGAGGSGVVIFRYQFQ